MLENRLADHHMAAPAVLLLVDPDLRLLARTDPSAATRPIESHILCEDGRISGLGQLDGPRLAAVCQESLLSPEPHQHVLTLVQDSPISLLATFNGLAAYAGLAPPCLLIQLRLREDAPHLRCRDLASRYRLTRTQSRILAALVEGLDPQTIARQQPTDHEWHCPDAVLVLYRYGAGESPTASPLAAFQEWKRDLRAHDCP
jgi:hypothetical protein